MADRFSEQQRLRERIDRVAHMHCGGDDWRKRDDPAGIWRSASQSVLADAVRDCASFEELRELLAEIVYGEYDYQQAWY